LERNGGKAQVTLGGGAHGSVSAVADQFWTEDVADSVCIQLKLEGLGESIGHRRGDSIVATCCKGDASAANNTFLKINVPLQANARWADIQVVGTTFERPMTFANENAHRLVKGYTEKTVQVWATDSTETKSSQVLSENTLLKVTGAASN